MSQTVCIIPARSGSKRLPGKNAADFHGRPLSAWTFDFALRCGAFSEVLLTTDDREIEQSAPKEIVRVERPPNLAGDDATLLQVIRHVIDDRPLSGDDVAVLMPVTGPLRSLDDLARVLEIFEAHGRRRTALTMCQNPHPPHLLWAKDKEGGLTSVIDRSTLGTRKQAFPATYFWNDSYLVDTVANFMDPERDLYGRDPVGVEVPPERSVPIDKAFDLWLAEQLFKSEDFLRPGETT